MSTFDKTNGSSGISIDGINSRFQLYNRVALPLTGITGDLVKAIPVPAGTFVYGLKHKQIVQGTGTTITLDFGVYGATADGFDASVDGKGTVNTMGQSTPSDTYPAAGGYYFATDGFIQVKLTSINTMTIAPTYDIWADCEDMNLNKGGDDPTVNE